MLYGPKFRTQNCTAGIVSSRLPAVENLFFGEKNCLSFMVCRSAAAGAGKLSRAVPPQALHFRSSWSAHDALHLACCTSPPPRVHQLADARIRLQGNTGTGRKAVWSQHRAELVAHTRHAAHSQPHLISHMMAFKADDSTPATHYICPMAGGHA